MSAKTILLSLLAFCLASANGAIYAQEDASTILRKMDEVMFTIKDKTVTVKMVMLNIKSQKEKVKEAVLMQKGSNMKLFRYTAPESDVGIATLSLPNNDIYLYLPMFKKPKKITNLAESNTFNKSDFSIEDMATKPYSELYTPTLLSTDGGIYKVDLFPIDETLSLRHLVVYINKDNYYPERFDFYNKKDQLSKTSLYEYIEVSGYWVPAMISMENLKKSHRTTLHMTDIKVNQGLEDSLFALENLANRSDEN